MMIGLSVETFKTDEGEDKEWYKLVLLGEGGETFICTLDKSTGAELLLKDEKSYAKKDVKVSGTLYRYKGLLKFKAVNLEILQK